MGIMKGLLQHTAQPGSFFRKIVDNGNAHRYTSYLGKLYDYIIFPQELQINWDLWSC